MWRNCRKLTVRQNAMFVYIKINPQEKRIDRRDESYNDMTTMTTIQTHHYNCIILTVIMFIFHKFFGPAQHNTVFPYGFVELPLRYHMPSEILDASRVCVFFYLFVCVFSFSFFLSCRKRFSLCLTINWMRVLI